MEELMIFNSEKFGKVRMVEIDGKVYSVAKDIALALGYKNTNDAISRHCKEVVKDMRYKIKGSSVSLIPITDILRLVQKSSLISFEKKKEFAEYFVGKSNPYMVEADRKEMKFVEQLEEQLSVFNIKGVKQYQVKGYRIDYYIPDLNIAVEYDEGGHINYTYKQHEDRQNEIEKELRCRFIRVTDKYSANIACAKVIKDIFSL